MKQNYLRCINYDEKCGTSSSNIYRQITHLIPIIPMCKPIMLFIFMCTLGCQVNKGISVLNFNDNRFEFTPTVIEKDGNIYLRYKLKDPNSKEIENRLVLMSRKMGDKAFYFLSGPTSYRELYNLNEVEIQGEILSFFEKGQLYWLNPDGTEIKLSL